MKKTILMFPGQGSQYIGMGQTFVAEYPYTKQIFEAAGDIIRMNVLDLCWNKTMKELTQTKNSQIAIFTTSMAANEIFMHEIGITPLCAAGHSLGEIVALTSAGAISFEDGVRIVKKRGELMQDAAESEKGKMMAVNNIAKERLQELCESTSREGHYVVVSNWNSPLQIIISGHETAVDEVSERIRNAGGSCIPMRVSAPFHSPLMQSAANAFKEELLKYQFQLPRWDVFSNVDAKQYQNVEEIVDKLSQQIISPVRWSAILAMMDSYIPDAYFEVGPKDILTKLLKQNKINKECCTFDKPGEVDKVKKILCTD